MSFRQIALIGFILFSIGTLCIALIERLLPKNFKSTINKWSWTGALLFWATVTVSYYLKWARHIYNQQFAFYLVGSTMTIIYLGLALFAIRRAKELFEFEIKKSYKLSLVVFGSFVYFGSFLLLTSKTLEEVNKGFISFSHADFIIPNLYLITTMIMAGRYFTRSFESSNEEPMKPYTRIFPRLEDLQDGEK